MTREAADHDEGDAVETRILAPTGGLRSWAAVAEPEDMLAAGRTAGAYIILRLLGTGGIKS